MPLEESKENIFALRELLLNYYWTITESGRYNLQLLPPNNKYDKINNYVHIYFHATKEETSEDLVLRESFTMMGRHELI